MVVGHKSSKAVDRMLAHTVGAVTGGSADENQGWQQPASSNKHPANVVMIRARIKTLSYSTYCGALNPARDHSPGVEFTNGKRP